MYGALAKMLKDKVYNIKWVGIIATTEKLTSKEERYLEDLLEAK